MKRVILVAILIILLSGCSQIAVNNDVAKDVSSIGSTLKKIVPIMDLNFFEQRKKDKAETDLQAAEAKMIEAYNAVMQQSKNFDTDTMIEIKSDLVKNRVSLKKSKEAFEAGNYDEAIIQAENAQRSTAAALALIS
ncbi:lipoprotein [Candidatus Woesearchaeota archaeon]|nr:lipoprotein [Candidatus Woesearchaeota archaeon]